VVTTSLSCCQVSEHAADCPATDHKHARSHFVCRAFDGHNFHPLVEDGKAESGDVLTSRSGRKIQLSRAARAVLRSKGCSDISVASPMVVKNDKQDKSQGNGYIDVVMMCTCCCFCGTGVSVVIFMLSITINLPSCMK